MVRAHMRAYTHTNNREASWLKRSGTFSSFKFTNTKFAVSKQNKFFEMERVVTLYTWCQKFSPRELQSKHAYTYPTWALSRYGSTENILQKDLLPLIRTILKKKKKEITNTLNAKPQINFKNL